CHLAQDLPVRPILAAPHDRHRADAQHCQLGKGILVLKHVDGDEGNAVLGQELLHPEATRAAGLPVCFDDGCFTGSLLHGRAPQMPAQDTAPTPRGKDVTLAGRKDLWEQTRRPRAPKCHPPQGRRFASTACAIAGLTGRSLSFATMAVIPRTSIGHLKTESYPTSLAS